jgi:hypothetical protein
MPNHAKSLRHAPQLAFGAVWTGASERMPTALRCRTLSGCFLSEKKKVPRAQNLCRGRAPEKDGLAGVGQRWLGIAPPSLRD